MKLAKKTEVELRDSLHEAIDRMSILEIVVLIFLVQMIRTREFVSHILPAPRKALPAPEKETLFPGLDAQIATGCTDPEPEPETFHIDLGSLGGVDIPVPAGALHCIVDPRTYIVRWSLVDGSVVDSYELDRHMRENGVPYNAYTFSVNNLTYPTMGVFPVGYCTPSRMPLTASERHRLGVTEHSIWTE